MLRLLLAVLFAAAALPAAAQPPGRGENQPGPRGTLKAVDPAKKTLTVSVYEGRPAAAVEKTYTLSADAEVAIDPQNGRRVFRRGQLADLAPGATVSLTLSADGKTVDDVLAEGANVRGVLKGVDAKAGTVTVASFQGRGDGGEEKAYPVAADAEVLVDDGRGRRSSFKEAKLADLGAGGLVTLRLSVDGKKVESVQAEGATVLGTVKAVDAGNKTVTVAAQGRDAEEKVLAVAADAQVVLDDGRGRRLSTVEGKLADVAVGSAVQARLAADGKTVVSLRAEGPTMFGALKALDEKKGTLTLSVRRGREEAEEKALTLDKAVRVIVEGKVGALADLKPADDTMVMVKMSLDQKAVQSVVLAPKR